MEPFLPLSSLIPTLYVDPISCHIASQGLPAKEISNSKINVILPRKSSLSSPLNYSGPPHILSNISLYFFCMICLTIEFKYSIMESVI